MRNYINDAGQATRRSPDPPGSATDGTRALGYPPPFNMTEQESPPELTGQLASQFAEISRGTQDLLTQADLVRKLRRGKPLVVKAGFDPTAPDLHLGHTVLLNKMRQFQQFGHEIVFLIGDFTGLIGDPTGRNATRPRLTPDEIQALFLRGATRLSARVRACASSSCDAVAFVGPDGDPEAAFRYDGTSPIGTPFDLGGLTGRYFQYEIQLETKQPKISPTLRSVTATAQR